MNASVTRGDQQFLIDLSSPFDLSIPLKSGLENLTAWYSGPPLIKAVESDGFIGDVSKGGSVNFNDIYFNPHAHGTHTECVGHISSGGETISDALKNFHFFAQLITLEPEKHENGDRCITVQQIEQNLGTEGAEALIIRTLPNGEEKKRRQYSHTNPPYIEHEAMTFMIRHGIQHFLTDLPSVDKEKDDGVLAAHKAFWEYPHRTNTVRTITEFIFVPESVKDGFYFMNLQVSNFVNDAGPSRPVIYPVAK